MDMSVLSSLTPEERAALKSALDQAEEKDPVEQLAEVVEYLCGENKRLEGRAWPPEGACHG